MAEETVNAFFDNLCQLIEATEKMMRSTTHKYAPLAEDAVNYVEGAFYSNLIRLYQNNLNEKFFETVRMGKRDRDRFMDLVGPYFERALETHESTFNKGEMDFFVYQDFRRIVYEFGDDTYWLLLGVERYADVIRCEHRLIQFKNEIADLMEQEK